MSLGNGMLIRLITLRAIERSKLALPGDASLKTLLDLLSGRLLERIRAPAGKEREYGREQDRQALHLLILRSKRLIARKRKDRQEAIPSP
jgi:hypothetical protein